MWNNHKKILLFCTVLLLPILILVAGCNKNESSSKTDDTHKKDSTVKEIIYTCPMHPEVTSTNKDDKCPKCGMALEEKKDQSMNDAQKMHSEKYSLMLTTEPKKVKAGEEVTLNFNLTDNETKKPIKDLEIVHEKILHLIIVSKNLAYFDHLHPEMNPDGSLSVKTKFINGGEYIIYADLTPKGEKHNQVFDIPLTIEGSPMPNIPLTPALNFETDGFTAVMTTDPLVLTVNRSTEIVVNLKKNGKDVTNLENYLGALGHMVVISEDGKLYLHVHPMEAGDKGHSEHGNTKAGDRSGSNVVFHTNFPKPGIYKVFAQFNPGGKLITTNFVVSVK